ncbi:MAG: CRISPR-associated endonuclease Cas2 [Mojavia pulchra JT2-VF2]|jgi:CRISPR-associated protein Cas2|uniref:CRISPR-associated endoribonuclease Cas2 n=1 Tax=Mojavia pulchra JT2-VF2 TaxID=287848 RepID=A0A951PWF6_9NOST|nr:CRISPR-associated endonuclease Cas2 [Mojavia pulchra JT2-VF2]
MNLVISYDISEDKRRTKIHNILKSYGQWMQYSVFECQLTDTQYAKLRSRLNKLIKSDADTIHFYPMCACCFGKVERIGGEPLRDDTIFFAEYADG